MDMRHVPHVVADLVVVGCLDEVLSGKLILPVSRGELFDTVEQQDSMADMAEEIATSFTIRTLPLPEGIRDDIAHFIAIVLENCTLVGPSWESNWRGGSTA